MNRVNISPQGIGETISMVNPLYLFNAFIDTLKHLPVEEERPIREEVPDLIEIVTRVLVSKIDYSHHLQVGGLAPDSGEFVAHTAEEVQGILGAFDATDHHSSDKSLKVLSFASCLTFFTGIISSIKGVRELTLGRKIEDITTQIKGGLHLLAGGAEIAAGSAFMGMTGATLGSFVTASHVAQLASEVFEHIGASFIGASTFFYSFYWGIEAIHLTDCRIKIDAEKDPKAVLRMIQKEINDPNQHLLWQKAIGSEMLDEVIANEADPAELVERINHAVNRKISIAIFYAGLSLAATILTALALSSVVFISPWVISVLGAVLGIVWLGNDLSMFIECLKNEHVGDWEKVWIYCSALFCLASIIYSLFLAKQLVSLAIVLTVGSVIGIVHYLAIHKIHINERAHS